MSLGVLPSCALAFCNQFTLQQSLSCSARCSIHFGVVVAQHPHLRSWMSLRKEELEVGKKYCKTKQP